MAAATMVSGYAQRQVERNFHSYLTVLENRSVRFDTGREPDNGPHEHVHHFDTEQAWKQWKTIANYTYGKDRGSLPMIADLHSLHPYFRDRIIELVDACRKQGIELAVVETFRTHAKQSEYFGMGRKYTRSKGGKSKHQYGLAVDVVPIVDSVAVWDNTALWRKIGAIGERLGLRWGGRWRAPYDPAHFEWAGGITTYQLAQGMAPFIPRSKAVEYPCIEEDLATLGKFYEAWEAEQAQTARGKSAENPGASGQ